MSLLTIVQDVCNLVSITVPTAVATNGSPEVQQMRALAQVEASELARRHDWRDLVRQHSFTAAATPVQPGSVPADMRKIVPGTVYRGDTRRPVFGPVSPSYWAYAQETQFPQTEMRWRLIGNAMELTPMPTPGIIVSYEFITKNWGTDIGTGSPMARWQHDNDETVLPEDVLTLGVVWRWKKAKGFDYGEDMVTYERALERASGEDGGLQTIVRGTEFDGMPPNVWPGVIRPPA